MKTLFLFYAILTIVLILWAFLDRSSNRLSRNTMLLWILVFLFPVLALFIFFQPHRERRRFNPDFTQRKNVQ